MNKKSALALLLLTLVAVVLLSCACTGGPNNPPVNANVEVVAKQSGVSLKNDVVVGFDYTTLFSVTVDGTPIDVTKEMLNLSAVSADADTFVVTCTYGKKSAQVTISVTKDVWTVELSEQEITKLQTFEDTMRAIESAMPRQASHLGRERRRRYMRCCFQMTQTTAA